MGLAIFLLTLVLAYLAWTLLRSDSSGLRDFMGDLLIIMSGSVLAGEILLTSVAGSRQGPDRKSRIARRSAYSCFGVALLSAAIFLSVCSMGLGSARVLRHWSVLYLGLAVLSFSLGMLSLVRSATNIGWDFPPEPIREPPLLDLEPETPFVPPDPDLAGLLARKKNLKSTGRT
ncbi:MAG: hypothetical protein HY293_20600 [Planctomycetes bacterium]|nr:hypothetical protein [Planctomycetota bacterium]